MNAMAELGPEDSARRSALPVPTVQVEKDMQALVQRFLARKRGDLDRLRGALATDDFETMRRIGHDLKGSGEAFGFPELSGFGAEIERAAVSSNRQALRDQLTAVEQFLSHLRVTFR